MTAKASKIGRPQMVDGDGVPTRARILTAALEAFVAKGYDAATLGEIARSADVSAPAIYNHFGSKSELFVEAARTAMKGWADRGDSIRDPRELLVIDASPEVRRDRRLLVELHTAALRHPDLAATLADWQQSHVERWITAGYGPEASARAYYVIVQGLALMDSLHIDEHDDQFSSYIERMSAVLFDQD